MITILGAGVAGLCAATALAERGLAVQVVEAGPDPLTPAAQNLGASWLAGGMLAAQVEAEAAPPEVTRLAMGAADWWAARVPGVQRRGMLVLAPPRDQAELARFGSRTSGHDRIGPDQIASLEPELAGRFSAALFYRDAAHLDPAVALTALTQGLRQKAVRLRYGEHLTLGDIDCRGLDARDCLTGLRAVRGEMLMLHSTEIRLSRPVRLLHPRFPLYVVPRGDGRFMLGATMLESDEAGPITARSMMELLSAAVALHPAFGEAAIVATGVGLRPAFADNIPRLVQAGGRRHLNGFYRHGFLAAPTLAQQLADTVLREHSERICHAH